MAERDPDIIRRTASAYQHRGARKMSDWWMPMMTPEGAWVALDADGNDISPEFPTRDALEDYMSGQ